MNEFGAHSSLFALVDSHLSKISLQENKSTEAVPGSSPGTLAGFPEDTTTPPQLFTPGRIVPLPNLGLSESPISSVLAMQVANMLRAKEKRTEEERQKDLQLEEPEEDDMMVDFSQILQTPVTQYKKNPDSELSSSSSCESLFKLQFKDYEEETDQAKTPEPLLPCLTDMSYILCKKLYMARCSNFGKVLSSKVRPVAPNYIAEKFKSNIKRFSFNSPSPCDLIKERLRRPTVSCSQVPNILE